MSYTVYKHISPSGKIYIGITSKKPEKRWNGGLGYLHNEYFLRAIHKYGWENIKHEILFNDLTKEEAEQKEIELIAQYKSDEKEYGYNIQHGGSSNGKHSEETKIKIGLANKGRHPWTYGNHHSEETKAKISDYHKETHLAEETKQKISEALKGRKQDVVTIQKRIKANTGKKRTEEQRKRISESLKGRVVVQSVETRNKISRTLSKPIICVETGVEYYGIREAERQTHIHSSSITKCLKGELKKAGGYHWEYAF